MLGKKLTQWGDQLQEISLEKLYQLITDEQGSLQGLVQQLRTIKIANPDAYRKAKTQLPYMVCGFFNPPVRKKENFGWMAHFVIDIDKLHIKDLNPASLRSMLQNDDRVLLLFTSPGNDGVKILFRLSERMHDAGLFSRFYKSFAASLCMQYRLEGLVDMVTHDVTRCCFLSFDTQALYNPKATAVNPNEFLATDLLNNWNAKTHAETQLEELLDNSKNQAGETTLDKQAIPDDVLMQIKQRLDPAKAARPAKSTEHIQPEPLNAAMPSLTENLAGYQMQIAEAKPIQYGKQLKIVAGNYWAEINLYYGKQKFTVVQTTKTGSSKELAVMAADAIKLFFESYHN